MGFVGGDIGGSVRLPDGRTVWFFGDTITSCSPKGPHFVHNAIVLTDRGHPRVIASVLPDLRDGSFFWPAAARAEGGHVWVLAARVALTGAGLWDFRPVGTWLARMDVAGWHLDLLRPVAGGVEQINWSAALFDRGPYTYVYGVEADGRSSWLHVARVPRGRLESRWRFYARSRWSAEPSASVRVLEGVSAVSVLDLGHRGLRLTSQQSSMGRTVYSWRAETPVGSFTGRRKIFDTGAFGERTYTYNAVAHPQYTMRATVLFSFNVNTYDFLTSSTASLYRPHFFRVSVSEL